ncbi:hypothetical protein CLAVI_000299 [Candidatus Clavichlamydia salmonicola]|uniref:hypothetical protein n=1 Tax=Candidatus Clavichlamydia salmonicola TaxID=469812 RepID=UPI0018912193|nr:hypothetical protein [Candidatus Clavichlamydia salmonicola]MBF5050684.1 hypothetical protein [Candidatus Clavichlamydia salmonicola]
MPIDPIACALQRTQTAFKEPLTATSPVIEMWRNIVESQFLQQCSPTNINSLNTFVCEYIRAEVFHRVTREGVLEVVLSERVCDDSRCCVWQVIQDKRSVEAMAQIVVKLKDLAPNTCCRVVSAVPNRWNFSLGPKQLLQLLFVMLFLFKEQKVYYRRFFDELLKGYYPRHYREKDVKEILTQRNYPYLVEQQHFLMKLVLEKLSEWKKLYIAMKISMGENIGWKVPSLTSMALNCMCQSSYQPWNQRSCLQLSPVYLERTFLIQPQLKEEFAEFVGLGIAPPVIAEKEGLQFCYQERERQDDCKDLYLIPFYSFIPRHQERLEQLILKKISPKGIFLKDLDLKKDSQNKWSKFLVNFYKKIRK